jgi:hypothetical protein
MRRKLEYAAAWPFIKVLGILPRSLSRAFAIASKNSWALAFEAMEEVVTIATRRTASKKMRG